MIDHLLVKIMLTTVQAIHKEIQLSDQNIQLVDNVMSAQTMVSFEAILDNVWQNQALKYNYEEDLRL